MIQFRPYKTLSIAKRPAGGDPSPGPGVGHVILAQLTMRQNHGSLAPRRIARKSQATPRSQLRLGHAVASRYGENQENTFRRVPNGEAHRSSLVRSDHHPR